MPELSQIITKVGDVSLIQSTNSTASSFSAKTATTTEPTGTGVITCGDANQALFSFFGTTTNNTTFDARVWGWKKTVPATKSTLETWLPIHLGTFSCTLSSALTGAASGATPNGTSDLFADTISIGSTDSPAVLIDGVADLAIPAVLVDLLGCSKFEVDFDMTGAVSGNGFYSLL